MSGGVDSSVAAALLARKYEVIGAHITKLDLPGLPPELASRDKESLASARRSAGIIGIPLRTIEAGRSFDALVDSFCAEYNAGRTPNPCVICNVQIKWRALLELASEEGAGLVATGHYARVEERDGAFHLSRSKAAGKDQTYFLHRLTQAELSRTVFPLAEMTKTEVKALARELGLPAAERAESQEICFVGEGGYREVLGARTAGAIRSGEVVDAAGRQVGRHEGYQFYTIGQRKGLGIALGRPAYVVGIDAKTARVTLGSAEEITAKGLRAGDVNWVVPPAAERAFEAAVKIRYAHAGARSLVTPEGTGARVEFQEAVRAVTPGQAAVFYVGDEVVGGGWITAAEH